MDLLDDEILPDINELLVATGQQAIDNGDLRLAVQTFEGIEGLVDHEQLPASVRQIAGRLCHFASQMYGQRSEVHIKRGLPTLATVAGQLSITYQELARDPLYQ